MLRISSTLIMLVLFASCSKDKAKSDLELFINSNSHLQTDFLIACAAGTNDAFMGNSDTPVSVFYYNVDGASEAKLFALNAAGLDPTDFANYSSASYLQEPLFNNRMGRFSLPAQPTDLWFVVVYTTDTKLHVSDPIHIRSKELPTADIVSSLVIGENGLQPQFDWTADPTAGNVIYFSLISDSMENFISGTYTEVKNWTFYDLNDVVLNVTPTQNPTLTPNSTYQYINMGVDEDNWVRSMGMKSFSTN